MYGSYYLPYAFGLIPSCNCSNNKNRRTITTLSYFQVLKTFGQVCTIASNNTGSKYGVGNLWQFLLCHRLWFRFSLVTA